jgi:hypothetical protein
MDALGLPSTVTHCDLAFKNRRGLDLLTAEKGGVCLFLREDCCFFTNKSGIVRDGKKKKETSGIGNNS